MRPATLARLIVTTNGPADQQAENEARPPRKIGTVDKAYDDTNAATAAFNELHRRSARWATRGQLTTRDGCQNGLVPP
jgi:hypothetical protein